MQTDDSGDCCVNVGVHVGEIELIESCFRDEECDDGTSDDKKAILK